MATFSSMDAFGRELERMAVEIRGAQKRRVTGPMADKAQKIIDAQVARDLTQSDFSGWTRSNPIKLTTEQRFGRDNAAIVYPTKTTAGPFTVLDAGRNKGNASGFAGPGVNRRTGLTSRTKAGNIRQQRNRAARRWNGYTSGKGTAGNAAKAIEKAMPDVAEVGVRKVMVRHFDVT